MEILHNDVFITFVGNCPLGYFSKMRVFYYWVISITADRTSAASAFVILL